MILCTFDRSCLQNPPATLVPVCMSIFRVATAVNSSWLQPASDQVGISKGISIMLPTHFHKMPIFFSRRIDHESQESLQQNLVIVNTLISSLVFVHFPHKCGHFEMDRP